MKIILSFCLILILLSNYISKQNNRAKAANPSTIISISQARILPLGSKVTIQGTITVASGTFSSSTPFGYALQDSAAGIYIIDSVHPVQGEFQLGEIVEVTGILEEWNNMLVIKELTALKKGNGKMISTLNVKTGNVNESTEGMILRTGGIIDSLIRDFPYGYKIYINDGSGVLNIFVNSSTGLLNDTIQWKILDSISVIGFLAQYKVEYEIEPRMKEDLKVFPKN